MPSAADIAIQAQLDDEGPARQRAKAARLAKQKKAEERATKAEREATKRFKKSVLPKWFPGVEWKFVETDEGREHSFGCDVWETGEGYDHMRLAVFPGFIRYVTHPESYDSKKYEYDRVGRWPGTQVDTLADVGRAHRTYRELLRWPDSANWAD